MNQDFVVTALRSALVASGASPDSSIELSNYSAPMIPVGVEPRPIVSQLDYDSRSGRFAAMLSVAAGSTQPTLLRVAGQVREMVEVPVPVARLAAGTVVGPDDVHMTRIPVAGLREDTIRSLEQTIGLQVTRQGSPGQPFTRADLSKPKIGRAHV